MDAEIKLADIAAVQKKYDDWLLRMPNVVGTGIGYRQRGGEGSDELCLVVMVRRKVPLEDLPKAAILPQEIDGIPLDVVETGGFRI